MSEARTHRLALGWRVAIVFVGVTLVYLGIQAGADAVFGSDYQRDRHVAIAVAFTVVVVPLVAVARGYLDRQRWSGLRLTRLRDGWRALLTGAACYPLPALVAFAAFVWFGAEQIHVSGSFAELLRAVAFAAVLVFLYEALPEELVFRGYLYRILSADMSPRLALVGQALLFACWGTIIWAVSAGFSVVPGRFVLFFALGLILGMFRVVLANVWAPIGFHLAFQTTVQLFGDHWTQFSAADQATIQELALGLIPLTLAVPTLYTARWLGVVTRRPVNWTVREPEG